MPNHGIQALKGIQALTFDVFGTVVDWRRPVEAALSAALRPPPDQRPPASASPPVNTTEDEAAERAEAEARARALTDADVAALAQEWRDSYKRFTRGFRPGADAWKDVDAHHRDSLADLLRARRLSGVLDAAGARELSLVWHRLMPWPDSAAGLRALGNGNGNGNENGGLGVVTAALSNGNRALLADLDAFGGLGFGRLFSAEDFAAYKPDPRVYLGAVERLGVGGPGEVAMVAAHLSDLDAARRLGLRTVYVERDGEEDWEVGSESEGHTTLDAKISAGQTPTM
ncbi:putative haloacid dehalogenase [Diaporthe ampelina]|uniref:Putative haloacid dehalogenase n=1 Tax=Diaporthe ampelina TaxID=1214573 RepID=A0A0G2FCV8_9PEZI|nr:putative haloacid dehalogenase [Diaporthe ampelina]